MSATRRVRGVAVALAGAWIAVLVLFATGGSAGAVPPTTPGESSVPATSDPAAPPAPEESTGAEGEIKMGTPKQGEIHWEQFGGDRTEAPRDLQSFSDTMIGYALTGFGIAAVVGGLVGFAAMIVGFRGRSQVAKMALEQSIWLYLAVLIVGSFSTIGGILVASAL
nr:hypothetical protein [Gordonia sp. LAM0048]